MSNPVVTTHLKAPKGTAIIVAFVFAFACVSLEIKNRIQEERDFDSYQALCRKTEELTWNPHPNYQAAEKLWRDELAARSFNSGRNVMYAKVATKLADLLSSESERLGTSQLEEAEKLYNESIKVYENLDGTADSSEAVEGLACLYDSQGKTADAEIQYKRCFNALKNQSPLKYKRISDISTELVELLEKQKRYIEAEKLLQEVIDIGEKTDLFLHGQDGMKLGELAKLYCWQGRYAEAALMYESAMKHGVSDINYMRSQLAYSLHKLGRDVEAEKLYKQNLDRLGCFQLPPELRPFDAQRSNNLRDLGELYLDQRRFSEAEPLLKEAININNQCMKANDSHSFLRFYLDDTKRLYQKLAKLYQLQGRKKEAEAASKSINELALSK